MYIHSNLLLRQDQAHHPREYRGGSRAGRAGRQGAAVRGRGGRARGGRRHGGLPEPGKQVTSTSTFTQIFKIVQRINNPSVHRVSGSAAATAASATRPPW